jgi:hypothetical protein
MGSKTSKKAEPKPKTLGTAESPHLFKKGERWAAEYIGEAMTSREGIYSWWEVLVMEDGKYEYWGTFTTRDEADKYVRDCEKTHRRRWVENQQREWARENPSSRQTVQHVQFTLSKKTGKKKLAAMQQELADYLDKLKSNENKPMPKFDPAEAPPFDYKIEEVQIQLTRKLVTQ